MRLRPSDTGFYDLFTQAARHLVVGAGLLAEMLGDRSVHQDVAARMRDAESLADETTHELVRRLGATFVTPLDRDDIYRLASALDDVMDAMDEAVQLIALYRVKTLPPELSQQVEVLQRCAELTADAMPGLTSPAGLSEYWIDVYRLENTGDTVRHQILGRLFSGEFKTIEVLKLKDIVAALGSAGDAFERVASTVEQIAIRES